MVPAACPVSAPDGSAAAAAAAAATVVAVVVAAVVKGLRIAALPAWRAVVVAAGVPVAAIVAPGQRLRSAEGRRADPDRSW